MSLRGIDAQVMVNRAANIVPEQSRVQRQPEVAQTQFANMLKSQVEENSNRTTAAHKSENEGIRNEGRGPGGGPFGQGARWAKPDNKSKETSEEPASEGTEGPRFDVRI